MISTHSDRINQSSVTGAAGVTLNVLESGNPNGPCVLFIHGFSQSAWAWEQQLLGALALTHRLLAVDIRGHGQSDKPLEPEHYTDGERWADDIAAVIAHTGANKVMLVGWSYGGYIMCDYLRKYGQTHVSGLVFVAAATKMGSGQAMSMLGKKLTAPVPALIGHDTTQTVQAVTQFVEDCFAKPPSIEMFYRIVGYNVVVPPEVRKGLFSRKLDNDDVLSAVTVPTAVVHGKADDIVLLSASEHIVSQVKHAKLHLMDDVGHCPFSEDQQAFDETIRSLVTE